MVGLLLADLAGPAPQAGEGAGVEVGAGEEAGVVGAIRDHDLHCVNFRVVEIGETLMAQIEGVEECEMHLSLVSLQTE